VIRRWILGSAGGLLLVALVVGAIYTIGVGTVVVCPRSTNPNWDPYDGTVAQARACGLTVYPLVSTTKLPDGGSRFTYQGPNGTTSTEDIPPAGFNALDASPSERALYDIPPEPPASNTIAHAHWLTEVESIKSTSFLSPTPFLYSVPGTGNQGLQSPGA
jgi:hypothetical protein